MGPMGPPGMDGPGMDGPGMDGPGMDGPGMDGCQLICCNPRYLNSIYDLYDDSQELTIHWKVLAKNVNVMEMNLNLSILMSFLECLNSLICPNFLKVLRIQRYLENMMLLKNMIILKSTMRNL